MNIAFFDFDGTLTKKDSFLAFILFSTKILHLVVKTGLVLPILGIYYLKGIPAYKAKEMVFSRFFGGQSVLTIEQVARRFTQEKIPLLLQKKGMNLYYQHQKRGDKIVVVSASLDIWLQYWCANQEIDLISTRAAIKDGYLTGKFIGRNCNGNEKARQIRANYNLSDYTSIYAYGNSKGDWAMLGLADFPFLYDKKVEDFLPFKPDKRYSKKDMI